jgi:hypothetical protein
VMTKVAPAITIPFLQHAFRQHAHQGRKSNTIAMGVGATERYMPDMHLAQNKLKLQPENVTTEVLAAVPLPAVVMQNDEKAAHKNLLDFLPGDPEQKKGLELIANAIGSGIKQATALKEEITAQGVSLKITNKQILLTF